MEKTNLYFNKLSKQKQLQTVYGYCWHLKRAFLNNPYLRINNNNDHYHTQYIYTHIAFNKLNTE